MRQAPSDALRLQTALRDLVALFATPAAWIGEGPPAVAAGLADALVTLLQLDFAFVRLRRPDGGTVDVTRGDAWKGFPDWLERQSATARFPHRTVIADVGDASEPCRGIAVPIGVDGHDGLVAAARTRSDFPTAIDQLLLSLAADHAATAFDNARLIEERASAEEALRQTRNELEAKVAARTAELVQLAEEQAALRRVATLVVQGKAEADVFALAAREVAQVFGVHIVTIDRYDSDAHSTVVASVDDPGFPVGSRWPLDGPSLGATVLHTGRAARIEDYTDLQSTSAAAMRTWSIRSAVGVPILVDDRPWGVICVANPGGAPLRPGIEAGLSDFTELLATAIARAEAREALARLADEQAALRRVATLVAEEESPGEVFAKVAEEAANILGNVDCGLFRDEGDGTATVVAARGAAISASFPVGARLRIDGDGVTASVIREGRPARIDDYSAAPGAVAEGARERRVGSAVGCPIVVRGGVWGALVVATSGERAWPPEPERHLVQFASLVATAISNAEARAAIERLVDEQAALRRVATLVAEGVRPAEIFSAVSDEVGQLFATHVAGVVRFDPEDRAIVLVGAARQVAADFAGARWSFDDALASARVYHTGRSARMGGTSWVSAGGPISAGLGLPGIVSTVASPIVVEGRLWGAMVVAASEELPPDAEDRMEKVGELVATAIANAESKSELAASRRRIVAASDDARRRIERDLHDGTQQRLVSLGLALRAAQSDLPSDLNDLRAELARIATGLAGAVEELQALSRGIHPAILAQGGLAPALRTLARRSAIPVALDLRIGTRLPAPIEVAAYYVMSEALANATKHAQASRIDISVTPRDGRLMLSIRDNGIGGADRSRGSGLVGLTDRVEALGGSISVESPPGAGTRITAELPLEPEVAEER
jgi:GAF domain-containing protein